MPPSRLLLLAALCLGLAHLLVLPPWQGEDEPWHVEVATLVARGHDPFGVDDLLADQVHEAEARGELSLVMVGRRFDDVPKEELAGLQAEILDSMRAHAFPRRVDWSGELTGARTFDAVARGFSAVHQPPTHYLVVGGLARLLGRTDPIGVLWIGRAVALGAYLAVVALGLWAARRLGLSPGACLLTGAVLTLWPTHARHAAVANNDVAAKLAASLVLALAADVLARRREGRPVGLPLALAGLGALGASLAKSTGLPASATALLVVVLALRRGRAGVPLPAPPRPALWVAAAALATAVLGLHSVGHAPVLPGTWTGVVDRLARAADPGFWSHLATTFVGSFNWESRLLEPALVATALVAWAAAAVLGWRALGRASSVVPGARALALAPLVLQVAAVAFRGASAGRYLLPALLSFALLAGAAVDGVEDDRVRRRRLASGLLLLVALSGWVLWRGLLWNQYGRLGA